MDKSAPFNAASAAPETTEWPHKGFVALATWFATQLPETYTIFDPAEKDPNAPKQIATITQAQRTAFIDALAEGIKDEPRRTNRYGSEYIEVTTDAMRDDMRYPVIWGALDAAGIGDAATEFEFLRTAIYKDGQVFAKSKRLPYDGAPAVPYIAERDLDFTNCPWMRLASRYLVVPLEEGQQVTVCRRKKGEYLYTDKTAGAGEALVVPALGTDNFDTVTADDALHLRYRYNIHFAMVCKAADYADGAERDGEHFQKMDDKGHCRRLSRPFRLFTATETFATGDDNNYYVMKPGDCITGTPGEKDYVTHEIVPRDWMDSARRIHLPSAQDGTLADLVTLDKPVTASRPFKLKPP